MCIGPSPRLGLGFATSPHHWLIGVYLHILNGLWALDRWYWSRVHLSSLLSCRLLCLHSDSVYEGIYEGICLFGCLLFTKVVDIMLPFSAAFVEQSAVFYISLIQSVQCGITTYNHKAAAFRARWCLLSGAARVRLWDALLCDSKGLPIAEISR